MVKTASFAEKKCVIFLLKPSIKNILIEFKNSIEDYEVLIEKNVLDKVIFVKIQPSLYGVTSYNLNIFIRDYITDAEEGDPKDKGAILAILLYETAHLLRHVSCKTYQQSKNIFTPKDNLATFVIRSESGKTEKELQKEGGEPGFLAERKLFGEQITKLNDYSARLLLNHSMEDINDFQVKFKEENQKDGPSINLARGRGIYFGGLRCGVSGFSSDFL